MTNSNKSSLGLVRDRAAEIAEAKPHLKSPHFSSILAYMAVRDVAADLLAAKLGNRS